MTDTHSGACMCGALTFVFHGQPKFVSECVCHSCRVAHGASVVAWVGVDEPHFELLQGASKLAWYASSTDSERGFCRNCGTRVFFRSSRWPGWIAAFVLFRFFDITKLGPVGWADRRGDPLGVMLDDVIAGVFAALGVLALAALYHGAL